MTGAAAEVDTSPGGRPALRRRRCPAAFAYLDLALVVLALPIVLLAGAPLLGFGVAAAPGSSSARSECARPLRRRSPNRAPGLIVAIVGLFLRLWFVTFAVVSPRAPASARTG